MLVVSVPRRKGSPAPARPVSASPLASARVDRQPDNPLHGVTLQAMLEYLIEQVGFPAMARAVDVRCFTNEPSLTSSLKFLRKVPWARAKVEQLYLATRARHRPGR
jgi:uncharacterized protein (DUF2132 family)